MPGGESVGLLGPYREHDGEKFRAHRAHQVLEHPAAALIGPVHVLDDQQGGPTRRGIQEQPTQHAEHPAMIRRSRRGLGRNTRVQRCEVAGSTPGKFQELLGPEMASQVAQHVEERTPRHVAPLSVGAGPAQDERLTDLRILVQRLEELTDQPGLPQACVALDDENAGVTGSPRGNDLPQGRELAIATDHRSPVERHQSIVAPRRPSVTRRHDLSVAP